MVTFAELQGRFPTKNVTPWGDVVIVPGTEFDPDWEDPLCEEGCKVFMADLGGKAVTLVKPKKVIEATGSEILADADPKVERVRGGWTEAEDQLLIKLWNQKNNAVQITAKFPKRTEPAIRMRLKHLQETNLIKRRWIKRRKSPPPEPERKPQLEHPPEASPVHAPVPSPSPIQGRESQEDPRITKIIETLGALTDLVDKVGCALLMQGLEIKQHKGELVIPPGLLIHYANALLEDGKEFRERFRAKVKKLLEASS